MIFTDDQGRKWIRVGECNHCGACCLGDDPSIKNSLFTDDERQERQVVGHCPLLRIRDGFFQCAGHDGHPFYLSGCHSFPIRPQDTADYPECSYSWELID